jgi:heme-degrading monooxygenase HmoA
MPIMLQADYPGVTQENYDTMMPVLEPGLRATPGFIAHMSMQTDDGWRVFEIWDSHEAADAWLQSTITPAMEKNGGSAPETQVMPLHYLLIKGHE